MSVEPAHGMPLRPPQPRGTVYRRFLPALASTFSLRVADIDRDLARFHDWMNQARVHRFWELAGDLASHREYLRRQLDHASSLPLIGEFDCEPFAYFEVYWAKEDRIAPHCDAGDFDRGCHVLVGESRFRGPARLDGWLDGLMHYMFLDEPRTQRIVGEPRVDNERFIRVLQQHGFDRRKDFDFPHKRAALMVLERETFTARSASWTEAAGGTA
ncbi:GNAT family N-acetyltransferase [Lysobacter sp. GCM10012299]|uniref:GNAT family N-acetyltransferase n=1 Tax=Lysobacter sp. GCM10012299 TaxID=3317333 RepID=UPI00361F310B